MANKKGGNKTMITGAVLGALAGAAYALWKTPMSGEELRSKLSTGPAQNDTVSTNGVHTPGAGEKILSKIEHTLAPIVGVELGKTADGPAPAFNAAGTTTTNNTDTEPVAPVKKAEQTQTTTPTPSANTDSSGSDLIGSRRFAWGDPAPEATSEAEVAAEPVAATEPTKEAPAAASTAAAGATSYGSDSIRAKRFAWGEPTPNAADDAAANDTSTAATATTETATSTQTTAAATDSVTTTPASADTASTAPASTAYGSPVEAVSDQAAPKGTHLRQFPDLGGLEK